MPSKGPKAPQGSDPLQAHREAYCAVAHRSKHGRTGRTITTEQVHRHPQCAALTTGAAAHVGGGHLAAAYPMPLASTPAPTESPPRAQSGRLGARAAQTAQRVESRAEQRTARVGRGTQHSNSGQVRAESGPGPDASCYHLHRHHLGRPPQGRPRLPAVPRFMR